MSGTATHGDIDVRLKLAALWISTSCLFATVDLLGLYRGDVADAIAAGEIGGFPIGGSFLLAATAYLLPPAVWRRPACCCRRAPGGSRACG